MEHKRNKKKHMIEPHTTLAIVALAALIHASFQLGVSVLTLLSGHSLSVKRSQFRVFRLTSSFVFGAGTMTLLLLSFLALLFIAITTAQNQHLIWSITTGLLLGVGIAVSFTYYRRGPGTMLWIPRGMADFLTKRTRSTRRSAEAFSLGMTSVFGELLFIIAPLAVSAYALIHLPSLWMIIGILLYLALSMLPLVLVWALVGNGFSISRIQRWREKYKMFLQYSAAAGLIVLGAFTFVNEVMGALVS